MEFENYHNFKSQLENYHFQDSAWNLPYFLDASWTLHHIAKLQLGIAVFRVAMFDF